MAKHVLKNIHRLIGEAVKETPPEESFAADLTSAIEKLHANQQRTPSQSYKPSSMSCVRNMYFQVVGAPQDADRETAELIGILQTGTSRHDTLQGIIASMRTLGMDCDYLDVADYIKEKQLNHLEIVSKRGYETKLYHKDLNISFMCDGIIKYRGQYFILEIKTESIHKFVSRSGVDPSHYPQASTYALCLEINEVMFVYECRDNTAKKVYRLFVTDLAKYEVLAKIELADSHVTKMTPPPIPADLPKKVCSYCRYKSECRKAGK